MRSQGGEWGRLLSPLVPVGDLALRGLPLAWLLLLAGWLASGVRTVGPDEVGLVLRAGALVGLNEHLAVRPPGLVVAPPWPIGEVQTVAVQAVNTLELRDLHFDRRDGTYVASNGAGLDPVRQGYALSGDLDVVHAALVVRWRVADPVAYRFAVADPEALLRAEVLRAAVRVFGRTPIDAVLTTGRAAVVEAVAEEAQRGLEGLSSGLTVVAVELAELDPPEQVRAEFSEVQSAAIDAQTRLAQAREYREQTLPLAQATADGKVGEARMFAASLLAAARGEAAAFSALADEYNASPEVVRERLYREGLEAPLQRAGKVRFVPPPAEGGRYGELRISVK